MKQFIILSVFLILSLSVSGQKSKVLAVRQMIDAGKYEEAKENIEQAVLNDKTSGWSRTYYMKGLLCQTAYETGIEKKESKNTILYPDQLFVAYNSYERALEHDIRERLQSQIRQQYYLLANDFRKLGEELYSKKAYAESLRAFEHALLIGESDLIPSKRDTNLVYNTALAAYESENWEKAATYLGELHEEAYSPGTTLLLGLVWNRTGDSLRSEEVLLEGMEFYHYEESLVTYLVNDLARNDRLDAGIDILNKAIAARPESFVFYWERGLVYRRMNNYENAISDFQKAAEIAPDTPTLYYHIGVSYYNLGIDLRESALMISENDEYQKIREQYLEKFREAVKWLERSYELDPSDEKTRTRLNQLYYQLQMTEQQKALGLTDG